MYMLDPFKDIRLLISVNVSELKEEFKKNYSIVNMNFPH